VFAEPSAVAIYAGAQRAVKLGLITSDERVALISTGSGLKDVKRAQESVAGGLRVPPDIAAIRRALHLTEDG
jgi:threonine synthase